MMVYTIGPALAAVARDAGLLFLSDHPIWYLDPNSAEQKTFYGDLVFAAEVEARRITASALALVIEVVSINDKRKEKKDVVFQRALNHYNDVPEFCLVFPDAADARSLIWCRLVAGAYREQIIGPGGSVTSASVPGLELRVLPREQWRDGQKLAVYYQGEHRPGYDEERAARLVAQAEARQERERADRERERSERLAAKLRELGVDPDAK